MCLWLQAFVLFSFRCLSAKYILVKLVNFRWSFAPFWCGIHSVLHIAQAGIVHMEAHRRSQHEIFMARDFFRRLLLLFTLFLTSFSRTPIQIKRISPAEDRHTCEDATLTIFFCSQQAKALSAWLSRFCILFSLVGDFARKKTKHKQCGGKQQSGFVNRFKRQHRFWLFRECVFCVCAQKTNERKCMHARANKTKMAIAVYDWAQMGRVW